MHFLVYCAVLGLVSAALPRGGIIPVGEEEEPNYVQQAFTNFSLLDALPNLPTELLTLRFGVREALLGNEICPFFAVYPPYVSYNANPKFLYTLICINVDIGFYFSGSLGSSFLKYLVVNIPGAVVGDGEIVADFKASVSPPGTRNTRNVCVAYRQPKKLTFTTEQLIDITVNAYGFKIAKFISQNRLGSPIAGNFYVSRVVLCDEALNKSC